ncbi:hypothetical protein HNO89_000144 [Sporosarcina luteola]|nr:hypothetical protein [Sporosarcina luteola]
MKGISLFLIMFLLAACSKEKSVEFPPYEGKDVTIGVIGEQPDIDSDKILFQELSFDELLHESESIPKRFDAIFIMPEELSEAADDELAEIYKQLTIPTIFIDSRKDAFPFVTEGVSFESAPDMGQGYASGILFIGNLRTYEFGLYNDIRTEKTIKATYTAIFDTI